MYQTSNKKKFTSLFKLGSKPYLYTSLFCLLFTLSSSFFFGSFSLAADLVKSHGISNFGDLKYKSDFKHLDYVNPMAPKNGEISTWSFGTFDSLNRYIVKGNAAASGNIFLEPLMIGTADEPDSMYGLLAESILLYFTGLRSL